MMKMNKKQLRNLLFAALFAATLIFSGTRAEAGGGISLAPLNPDFVRYVEELRAGRHPDGMMPSSFRTSFSTSNTRMSARAAVTEVSFDLKAKGWLTGVKDQRSWGTCWDFSTIEALESNLLKETGTEYFLSELHLGFFAFYDESDDKPAFDSHANRNPIFDNGAQSAREGTAILARGTGPVYEVDAPYPNASADDEEFWSTYPPDPEALKEELLAAPNRFRLKESLIHTTPDDIKRALMAHGALWTAIDSAHLSDKKYVYHPEFKITNHIVLLVGWDDTISADLFISDDYKPSRDGAWRIQNSWGEDRGDGGFNWISYDDATIFGLSEDLGATSYVAMPVSAYEHVYSYDPLGVCHAFNAVNTGSSLSVETANVFTAERDEDLVYVGLQTVTPGTEYSIQIYTDLTKANAPDSGTPVLAAPIVGTADYAGYRSVKLPTPVALAEGTRFAVRVTLSLPDSSVEDLYIPIEAAIDRYSSKATAKSGESYIKVEGDWTEVRTFEDAGVKATNLCIKAFTNSAEAPYAGGSSGCATGAFALLLISVVPLAFCKKIRKKR